MSNATLEQLLDTPDAVVEIEFTAQADTPRGDVVDSFDRAWWFEGEDAHRVLRLLQEHGEVLGEVIFSGAEHELKETSPETVVRNWSGPYAVTVWHRAPGDRGEVSKPWRRQRVRAKRLAETAGNGYPLYEVVEGELKGSRWPCALLDTTPGVVVSFEIDDQHHLVPDGDTAFASIARKRVAPMIRRHAYVAAGYVGGEYRKFGHFVLVRILRLAGSARWTDGYHFDTKIEVEAEHPSPLLRSWAGVEDGPVAFIIDGPQYRAAAGTWSRPDNDGLTLVPEVLDKAPTFVERSVTTMLDLNTRHVKGVDFGELRTTSHVYGWIVYVRGGATASDYAEMPEWIRPIHRYADVHGCMLIHFDSDAEVSELFNCYDDNGAQTTCGTYTES